MDRKAITLSLVIASIAIFMVYSYIEGREAQFIQEYGNAVPVVVAKVDINELETIDDRKVQIISVPERFKMTGAFNKVEDIYNTLASVPIKAGEQITPPRVSYPGSRSGLARQITPGKRAFAFTVDDATSVGKLIKPGDRVDVITLLDYASGLKEKMKVKTILQDVYVLATGYKVTKDLPMVGIQTDAEVKKMNLNTYTNFNTVTLELTPYEVQKMYFLLRAGGGFVLSLRNNDDKNFENISGTKLFDVLGEDAAEARTFFQQREDETRRRN
jgi:pilus assembly protein CpaB